MELEEERLSEICSSATIDTDSDGIPDDCDCEPNSPVADIFEIFGDQEVCDNEQLQYSISINGLVINEIDFIEADIIELKNYGVTPVDITGFFLCTNDNCTLVSPNGTWKSVSDDYIIDSGEVLLLSGGFLTRNQMLRYMPVLILQTQLTWLAL